MKSTYITVHDYGSGTVMYRLFARSRDAAIETLEYISEHGVNFALPGEAQSELPWYVLSSLISPPALYDFQYEKSGIVFSAGFLHDSFQRH